MTFCGESAALLPSYKKNKKRIHTVWVNNIVEGFTIQE